MNDYLPGISVLLPIFMKTASFENINLLKMAIKSIVEQEYAGPMEILVIDDGSPVAVENFKNEFTVLTEKIRWIRLNENKGIVFALNHGIKCAQYEFIARMDADDIWLPGKLKDQMSLFANDPDLSIVATGMKRVDDKGNFIDNHIRPGDWQGILDFFVNGGCPFPHGSIVAKRQVYQLLGGYSYAANVRHCEDYALWGVWLRFFKPAMVEKALYQYRVSNSSVSVQHATSQANAARLVRERFSSLQLTNDLPHALQSLAKSLTCDLIEAGTIAYLMWQYGACVALPESARMPLSIILPDRLLSNCSSSIEWQSLLGKPSGKANKKLVGLIARPY